MVVCVVLVAGWWWGRAVWSPADGSRPSSTPLASLDPALDEARPTAPPAEPVAGTDAPEPIVETAAAGAPSGLVASPPDLYLRRVKDMVAMPRYVRFDNAVPQRVLPGHAGPKVTVRGSPRADGAIYYRGPRGYVTLHRPDRLPGGSQRVLLFGASAVYGDRVKLEQTVGELVQTALRNKLNRPGLRVVNLARPAWELNSVAALLRRVVPKVSPPPLAVVLCTGNNEFLSFNLPGQQGGVFAGPVADQDPTYFRKPDWGPILNQVAALRVFSRYRGLPDARFWPTARQVYLQRYRELLTEIVTSLRRLDIPLVLVSPPINLHLFVGGLQPQPVTFRPVGARQYDALRKRLVNALKADDMATITELVTRYPDGPIQRYFLAQHLEKKGELKKSRAQFYTARDRMMGILSALPTMARVMNGLAGPGVTVVDTSFLYPEGSTWKRSRQLFADTCHLSPMAHGLLAERLADTLAGVVASR